MFVLSSNPFYEYLKTLRNLVGHFIAATKKNQEKKTNYKNIKILFFFYFFYVNCRKRFRVNSEDDVNLVHREQAIGKQTKSVQVLVFF